MNTLDQHSDRWFANLWRRVREQLRAEMAPPRFEYWIAHLRVASADPERVVIICPTSFLRDQITAKFGKQIADLIAVSLPRLRSVDFIVDPTPPPRKAPMRPSAVPGLRRADGGTVSTSPGAAALDDEDRPPTQHAAPSAEGTGEAKRGGARIMIEDVKRKIAEYFGIPVSALESASRKREIVRQRHTAMFVARNLTGRSYPEIARRFGSRDHTTVIHGCEKIRRLSEADPKIAAEIEALKRSLLS